REVTLAECVLHRRRARNSATGIQRGIDPRSCSLLCGRHRLVQRVASREAARKIGNRYAPGGVLVACFDHDGIAHVASYFRPAILRRLPTKPLPRSFLGCGTEMMFGFSG